MQDPVDRPAFALAMKRLSTMFPIELTDESIAAYWDALCDLRIEDVIYAYQHAARHFRPSKEEGRVPVASILREYARLNRDERVLKAKRQAQQQARRQERTQIPQVTETIDEMGLQAIRNILNLLEKSLDMAQIVPKVEPTGSDDPLAYRPSEDPEEAKARLREQFRLLRDTEEGA